MHYESSNAWVAFPAAAVAALVCYAAGTPLLLAASMAVLPAGISYHLINEVDGRHDLQRQRFAAIAYNPYN